MSAKHTYVGSRYELENPENSAHIGFLFCAVQHTLEVTKEIPIYFVVSFSSRDAAMKLFFLRSRWMATLTRRGERERERGVNSSFLHLRLDVQTNGTDKKK